MRAFAEISDYTIRTFIELYETVAPKDGVLDFELINRNFFLQTTCMRVGDNNPIQGMVWKNTKIYYEYCKQAVATVDADKLVS